MSKSSNRNKPKQQDGRSKHWTTGEARAELNAWRQSGMTMVAYCRERGFHVNRLYTWRKRLEEWIDGGQASSAMVPGVQKSVRLIEATVGTQPTPALTLRMGDGGCIEVADPERVDVGWLIGLSRGLSKPELQ